MPTLTKDLSTFWQDGSTAGYIACPDGSQIVVSNLGNTLYYKSTSSVTSSSSDGSIATAASQSFTKGIYVICATGVQTQVNVTTNDGRNQAGQVAFTGWRNIAPATTTTGTNSTPADGTQAVTSVFVPVNSKITGIAYLIGGTGGTNKCYAVLYDAAGNVLGNSSVTSGGATVGTASTFQTLALTAAINIVGPALYYVGVSINGTTARICTIVAGTQSGVYTGTAAQTHGTSVTVAAITPPVTFTTNVGPYVYLY